MHWETSRLVTARPWPERTDRMFDTHAIACALAGAIVGAFASIAGIVVGALRLLG